MSGVKCRKWLRVKAENVCNWFLLLVPYRWLFAICAWSRGNWQYSLILMSEFNIKTLTLRSMSHNWSVIFVFHCRPAAQKRFWMAFIKSHFPTHLYMTQSEPDHGFFLPQFPQLVMKRLVHRLPLTVKRNTKTYSHLNHSMMQLLQNSCHE